MPHRVLFRTNHSGQIIATKPPVGHPKWWFSKEIHPKFPKKSGLGIIRTICPEIMGCFLSNRFVINEISEAKQEGGVDLHAPRRQNEIYTETGTREASLGAVVGSGNSSFLAKLARVILGSPH